MDLRRSKSVACMVAGWMAVGCAGGHPSTIPDAARTGPARAPDEKPTDDASAELPIAEAALPARPEVAPPPSPQRAVAAPETPPDPVVVPPDPPPSPGEQRVYSAEVCPVGIPGLDVRAAPARGGAELVFTADPMHRRALRERIARLAELHGEARRARAGETTDPPATFGDEDAPLHHAQVRAVATEDGARLIARADRPADVDALRQELEEDASALARGACPLAFEIVG